MDETKFEKVWYLDNEPEDETIAAAIALLKDGKYGLVNNDGLVLMEADDADTFYPEGGFVKKGNKWGFIDYQCKWLIEPSYEKIWPLSYPDNDLKGMAIILADNKVGLINRHGRSLVELTGVKSFDKDLGGFAEQGGKWGYLDIEGNWLVEPKFDSVYDYKGERAFVKIDGKTGIIDRKGNWVLKPGEELKPMKSENGKFGYVDNKGAWVIEAKFDEAGNIRHPERFGFADIVVDGKAGIVLSDGSYLVEPRFDEIGIGWIDDKLLVKGNGKWGYVNKDYSWLFEPVFDEADDFYREVALVKRDGKYGYVKADGTYLAEPQFDQAYYFKFFTCYGDKKGLGIALVRAVDFWGFLGSDGKWVMEPQFESVVTSTEVIEPARPEVYRDGGYGYLCKNEDGKFFIDWEKEPTQDNKLNLEENRRKSVVLESFVAGLSHYLPNKDERWEEIEEGDALALVRDRNNKYDENAVAVAFAKDYDGNPDNFDFRQIIGYLPKSNNEDIAEMLDAGKILTAKIIDLDEYASPKERIKIRIYETAE